MPGAPRPAMAGPPGAAAPFGAPPPGAPVAGGLFGGTSRPPIGQFQNLSVGHSNQGAPTGTPGAPGMQPRPVGQYQPGPGMPGQQSPIGVPGAPQAFGLPTPGAGVLAPGGMPGAVPPGVPGPTNVQPRPLGGVPGGPPAPFGGPPRPGFPGYAPPPGPPQQGMATPGGGSFMPPGPPLPGPPPPGGAPRPPPPGGVPPPVVPPPCGPVGFTSPTSQATGGRVASTNRIDPSQIPRPVAQTAELVVFETRSGGVHNVPPPSASRFIVRDRGSCSPRYMRATLNNVPATNDLILSSAMPFAICLQPLALPDPADDPVQVVDLGELGPVRCGRCKAYMNPFMRFMSSGRTFVCNFCGHSNSCPDAYFCHLGADGRRRDADERPELSKGTVEFVAPAEYMVRPPMPPVYFFLIEVTQTAVSSGATAACCSGVQQVLDSLQGGDRTLVGLATYDNTIQFYSFRSSAAQPQMLVVTDVNDVYAPTSAPLLSSLSESKEQLSSLLESIPNMFAASRIMESCALAAIEAAVEVLKPTGGKIHTFLSSLATVGSHALKPRDFNLTGERAEKEKLQILCSQDSTIKNLAVTAAEHQICVDLSILAQGYVDVASLSDLPLSTSGSVYNYTPFHPVLDFDQLVNDLKWNVSRPQGLEAVMRLRCSQGMEVEAYNGSFYRRPNVVTDIDLPALDCEKSIVARLMLTEKLNSNTECYVQNALLYTTTDGQRRIRVSTLALPVVDNMSAVFKAADLDSQIHVMARRLAISLPGGTLGMARETATNSTVNTLYAYRKFCATSSSAVQLILPEALKLLPLYTLALLKSHGLRTEVKPDVRALWVHSVSSAAPPRVCAALYPRLIPVHKLLEGGRTSVEVLPEGLMLSSEFLDAGGVYLLETGMEAFLYMDSKVTSELLFDMLGVQSLEELARITQPLVVPVRDTPANKLLQDLLGKVRSQRCSFLRTRVVRKAEPAEVTFFNLLVEDRSAAGQSYVEYLCQVHRMIQNKVS